MLLGFAVVFLSLAGLAAFAGLVLILRYVPVVERNAFEVPRFQPPQDIRPMEHFGERSFKIPYDTRYAIEALYIEAKEPSKKLVVFCHETGADLKSWYKHASFLPQSGIDVLSFNFRLSSLRADAPESEDLYQWPSVKDLRCLERVLSWVAMEKRGYEVALFGVSKGATVACAAAPSPLIRSLLVDGAFSTHMTLQKYMKKWVTIYVQPRELAQGLPDWVYILLSYTTLIYAGLKNGLGFFSVEKFFPKLKKPVFWIHAGKDYHVQLEHVQRLLKLIPGVTDLWVAEKAGHSEAVLNYPDEYNTKIVNFLNKTLA